MTDASRYSRQIQIPQIQAEGQKKLENSSVAVIGCGGLGGPVLTYLALAGVGKIRLIDYDTVAVSNLNRQFLYEETQIGKQKSVCAGRFLERRNSSIKLEWKVEKLTEDNAEELLKDMDVIVDCVDDIIIRKLVNRTCVKFQIPLVEGGIHGFYGYVMPVRPGQSACLECAGYAMQKKEETVPALGAVAGVIGSLQAVECLKILLHQGEVHYGSLLQYDGLGSELTEIPVRIRRDCFCQTFFKIASGSKP